MQDISLKNGSIFRTAFRPNGRHDSPFRFKAGKINGRAASKIILSNDGRIIPGRECEVRVVSIGKGNAARHGAIVVEWAGEIEVLSSESLYLDPILESKVLILLEEGQNILLDGPQGSGKTTLSGAIAGAMGMRFVYFNVSSVVETTEFLASLQLKSGENGSPETIWVKTDILRALEEATERPEERWLIFLDEFNRTRNANAVNGILPALDHTRALFNPLTGSTIHIPDNVSWIAAVNHGPQYTGTTTIDPAQLDRFSPLKLGYPPAAEEIKLLKKLRSTVATGTLERLVAAANAVRQDPHLGLDLSMRATEEATLMLANPRSRSLGPDPLLEILKTSFCGRFPGHFADDSTDAGLVWEVVKKSLSASDPLREVHLAGHS